MSTSLYVERADGERLFEIGQLKKQSMQRLIWIIIGVRGHQGKVSALTVTFGVKDRRSRSLKFEV